MSYELCDRSPTTASVGNGDTPLRSMGEACNDSANCENAQKWQTVVSREPWTSVRASE